MNQHLAMSPPQIAREAGKSSVLAMYPAETQHSVPEVKDTCWNFEWFLPLCPSCVSSGLLGASPTVSAVTLYFPPPGPVGSTVLHMSITQCLSVNDS